MNELTTPVASACGSSAAWIVTGCAPISSAIRAVYGLYARHLEPARSATELIGLFAYRPCGGQGIENSTCIPRLAKRSLTAAFDTRISFFASSKLVTRNGTESM